MKINPTQGKRNREQLTITTELLGALKEANLNASWKVQSSKFAKNRTTLLK
jgi:hypothetical protein